VVKAGRPKAARGWGEVPPHHGKGSGRLNPSPEFFFNFGPQNGQFRCTVGASGGMHPPHPPPGSATVRNYKLYFVGLKFCSTTTVTSILRGRLDWIFYKILYASRLVCFRMKQHKQLCAALYFPRCYCYVNDCS